ncbi:MAG: hypothetical protein JKY37_31465 [Nannocystaceae bacterium]|nr:hypothetical protein [Nannocystaceae bacterium]
MQWCSAAGGLRILVLVFGFGSLGLAPAAKPSKEELEYSKKLYAAGEEAMAAGEHAKALANYQEGYRFAPSLHIFTLNIALAADGAGDCATAKKYFQHFVDLVPSHDQRQQAKTRLAVLATTCTAELPQVAPVAAAPTKKRKSRREREGERALNRALQELVDAREMYTPAASRFKDTRQIGRAARRKKRHAKRMRAVIVGLGVEVREPEASTREVPKSAAEACRRGRAQERGIQDAMETVLEYYDGKDVYRSVRRFARWSDRVDRPAFEECT